jgi:hypothetical protein
VAIPHKRKDNKIVNIHFKKGSDIFLLTDIEDDIERKLLEEKLNDVKSLIGSLVCPHKAQLCDITIDICNDNILELVVACHQDYIDLIRKHLVGSKYILRNLTV